MIHPNPIVLWHVEVCGQPTYSLIHSQHVIMHTEWLTGRWNKKHGRSDPQVKEWFNRAILDPNTPYPEAKLFPRVGTAPTPEDAKKDVMRQKMHNVYYVYASNRTNAIALAVADWCKRAYRGFEPVMKNCHKLTEAEHWALLSGEIKNADGTPIFNLPTDHDKMRAISLSVTEEHVWCGRQIRRKV